MTGRRRHQDPDIEKVLRRITNGGWTVEDKGQLFHVKCHCGHHRRFVHATPSGSRFAINLLKYCQRCWKERPS